MTTTRTLGVLALAAVMLASCSTVSKVGSLNPFHGRGHRGLKVEGTRIPVIALNDQLQVASSLKGQDFYLPPPSPPDAIGPFTSGTPVEQSDRECQPRRLPQLSPSPGSEVSGPAMRAITSSWPRRSLPAGESSSWMARRTSQRMTNALARRSGGGTFSREPSGAMMFTAAAWPSPGARSTLRPTREVVQLDAASGHGGWRATTDAPIHAAPTVVDGRVLVADLNDQLLAFDAATGAPLWSYQALTEPARILAASSPAVANDTVVTSFASGELVAVRSANGNELWDANLSNSNQTNALSEIRDIPGRPVIYKTDVFAVSHASVLAATDLRTGAPRWTLPVSGITTPWPVGDVVFVVDQNGQIFCASREGGEIYWITDLNASAGKKKKKDKHPTYWSSPVVASSRVITVSSKGEAVALNPKTGAVTGRLRLGSPAVIGPIAAAGMVYVVTEQAQLIAIR